MAPNTAGQSSPDYLYFSMQILYESGVCCQAQPMFGKTVHKQKHPRLVNKCINSLPHNFFWIQNHYCQCPVQWNLCLERAGQLVGHPLPHQLGICHLVWQLISTYMKMYIAEISTCFAMGAFISSITSTSVLVHLIYTCGAIHTRITCTFVSIWEIRFEHALF